MSSSERPPLSFEFGFGQPVGRAVAADRARILVVGDFVASGDTASPAASAVHAIGWENFDQVMARLQPMIALEGTGFAALPAVTILSMDDFHPDRLFASLGIFDELQELRRRLADPHTFKDAAAELKSVNAMDDRQSMEGETESHSDLERLLGGEVVPITHQPGQAPSLIDKLLREAVRDAVVAAPDPEQAQLLSAVDNQISLLARRVLHDPAFERVEALWRSVYELVCAVDTGSVELTFHITSISEQDLATDLLTEADQLRGTVAFQRITASGERLGGEPWSLVVADYYFDDSAASVERLAKLAAVCRAAGAPLITGGVPGLVGAPDRASLVDHRSWRSADDPAGENWRALRGSDIADALGVVLPRVLLRHPYDPKSDPIDSFQFSEQTDPPDPDLFLWGNGAFICARLLAQSFVDNEGWRFDPNAHLEVRDLPLWTNESADGKEVQPVAEIALPDSTADEIDERGLMALCSNRRTNACRLFRVRSVSERSDALLGPWSP